MTYSPHLHVSPECMAVWNKALAYVSAKTAAFDGTYAALFSTKAYQDAEHALGHAMHANDVDATKAACRQVWTLAIAYMQQEGQA